MKCPMRFFPDICAAAALTLAAITSAPVFSFTEESPTAVASATSVIVVNNNTFIQHGCLTFIW